MNDPSDPVATDPAGLAISDRYKGDRGADYVSKRQANATSLGYALNFESFSPYLTSTDRVLDFGCGNGGMLPLLQKQCAEVEAVEVNASAAAMARQFGVAVHASIHDVGGRPFDAVVSNHVLEHVRDVCSTLEAIRSKLRPGGRLIVKLPIDDVRDPHQRRWSENDIDFHLQTWTPRLFANVLVESGYRVKAARIVTSAWHPRLFRLRALRLDRLAYWALAVWKARRQLIAVAENPS